MAGFPIIEGTATTADDSGGGIANLPSGIQSGDFLLLFVRDSWGNGSDTPTGWTSFDHQNTTQDDSVGMSYRVATGSEGSTVTVPHNGRIAVIVYRISNWDIGLLPFKSFVAENLDPAALTPASGLRSYLWFVCASGTSVVGVTQVPGSTDGDTFGNQVYAAHPTVASDRCTIVVWTLAKVDNSLDPTSYSFASNIGVAAWTVAIAGPEVPPKIVMPQVGQSGMRW